MVFYCGEEDVLLSLSNVQRTVILTRIVEDIISTTISLCVTPSLPSTADTKAPPVDKPTATNTTNPIKTRKQ